MKVLFFAKGSEYIGIEYLSAILKREGHEVDLIFDPGFDVLFGFIDLPILKKVVSKKSILKRIEEIKPDLIAFSCMTNLFPYVKEMADLIKSIYTIPIIVGGIHPTQMPELVISHPSIDMICRGEGDEAMVELLNRMESKQDITSIKNIWVKTDGKISKNDLRPLFEDLDFLPFPDRDLFYKFGTFVGSVAMNTGRGCPFKCTFCYNHSYQKLYKGKGHYVRRLSVDSVIEDAKLCKEKYKPENFIFFDDTFTLNPSWIAEFSKIYTREIGIPFFCNVRPHTLSKQLIKNLKKAGCSAMFLGLDSGSDFIRNQIMERGLTQAQIIRDAALIREHGIKIITSSIYGLPNETPEMMWETLELTLKVRPDGVNSFIFYPFPGTRLAHYAKKEGCLSEDAEERVNQGEGSFHRQSLLSIPYKDEAEIMKNLTPVVNKSPLLRGLLRFFIKKRLKKLSMLIYLLTAWFSNSSFGCYYTKQIVKMFTTQMKFKLKRLGGTIITFRGVSCF